MSLQWKIYDGRNTTRFYYTFYCPCVDKGSNLIFWYKFMVCHKVPFCTSESLIIFWMGYIIMYMFHEIAPQHFVHCILTLQGNDQISRLSLTGNLSSLSTPGNIVPSSYFGAHLMYLLSLFLYDSLFYVGFDS